MTFELKQIAQTTAGFTGADLENLLNEAAIVAAKDRPRAFIVQEDIKKSFVKVGIGAEKKTTLSGTKKSVSLRSTRRGTQSYSMCCRM